MRWWHTFAASFHAINVGLVACAHEQTLLSDLVDTFGSESWYGGRAWDEPPHPDATGNLIFQALASLLQLGPNSKYKNGHSIIRASIPPGTLLYHGRTTKELPTRDWIAVDPEHSQLFAAGANSTLFTFMSTRDLRFIYFDGCSGNKFDGVVDAQDVLFWGEVNYDPHDGWVGELARFQKMCKWVEQYGLDGIVRMQYDFEIMYCDIANGGLELVSAAPLVANEGLKARNPDRDVTAAMHMVPRPPNGPFPHLEPMMPPEGWVGSLPPSWAESKHTGAWHNKGEVRIRVDPSSIGKKDSPISMTALASWGIDMATKSWHQLRLAMLSYDGLASHGNIHSWIVEARRSMKRVDYRLTGISKHDVARVQSDVAEVLTRDSSKRLSGVDWQALARVLQDRFADRLPFVRHLAHQTYTNATEQAVAVRREVLISLLPYMSRDQVGLPGWYAHMAGACATRYTSHLPVSKFTKQEHVLYSATREVLHEICRVYTDVWRDAFDVEEHNAEIAAQRLEKWRHDFDGLIQWLDWPLWMGCDPGCGVDEYCSWPQDMPWESGTNTEAHCVPLGKNVM